VSTDESDVATSRVTRKGQVTIPKELREEFGLEEGDEIRWERTDGEIRIRKATQSAGRGMLVPDDVSDDTREEIARELEASIRDKRRSDWTPE